MTWEIETQRAFRRPSKGHLLSRSPRSAELYPRETSLSKVLMSLSIVLAGFVWFANMSVFVPKPIRALQRW